MFRGQRVGAVALRGALVWALVLGGVRLFVLQPERCGDPSYAGLEAAAQRAVDWLVANQRDDGSWLYRYDRDEARDLGGYNVVRHAGVTMSLEQAASAGLSGAAEAADAGTAWAIRETVEHGDWSALGEAGSDRIPTGASALWLAALVERRERTGDPVHDELMVRLGRFLEAQVEPSGAVLASWDSRTGAPVPGEYSVFFTGEALWALAGLHLAFPDGGWDQPASRIAHYLATERDDAEGNWPDVPDHWAAYGLAEIAAWPERPEGRPLTDDEHRYALRQAQIQSVQVRYESQRLSGWWTHLTRGRPTLGAGAGTVGEALGGWWRVASLDERLAGERDAIGERALCMAGVLERRQVDGEEAAGHPEPERVEGAWFQFGVTQMDDQQHALSALLAAMEIEAAG